MANWWDNPENDPQDGNKFKPEGQGSSPSSSTRGQSSGSGGGSPHGPYWDQVQDYFGGSVPDSVFRSSRFPSRRLSENLFGPDADPNMLAEFLTGANMPQPENLDQEISQSRSLVDSSLYASLLEAIRLRDESDRRHEEHLGFLQGEFERANVPTFTDADIDRMFGKAADKAGVDAQQMMGNLRGHLGASGVRGGAAAGLASAVELQRLGQLTGARRDLTIFKANADAQDRINRWKRSMHLGDVMGEEPSPFLSDVLGSISQIRLAQEGLAREERAAGEASDAARDAGMMQMLAGIVGNI